uniref:bis(5'-nucleosyl)-tetraphosphatase (symmetrical) n=1 Tax=Candidatus Kentrum sp. MB TaxID=2138164 RepID=A0A451BEU2_9GAMM|nr:MAG: Bis(5'nucleosyl)-tetraphosphatase, ApaH [Candidatus Kentron sp. MB]VFK34518.1 MAG: Bis(5'nucleosyl)-tetraphosphatase, ApaH [Candidatus Kentron sp. MB]VFK76798.1 MAG: Bis(5'nucleosyl)-tetraphosphatase, ApaH [Candidatus Kentron sp. MB]
MSTYAIGDIQGCFAAFSSLLARIGFDPAHDSLWLCGDLVNRGPESARVVRFLRDLGEQAVVVLGNHDLNLLAVASGSRALRGKDTCADILNAPDRDELLDWLRHRPLLHHDAALGFTMTHAGLPPTWDLTLAMRCAGEVESTLRDDKEWRSFVANMYGNEPSRWSEELTGWDRLRFITNSLTRLRHCADGALDLNHAGPPGSMTGLMPWFALPDRRSIGERILFGHWATLILAPVAEAKAGKGSRPAVRKDLWEFFADLHKEYGVYPLDMGCVWGHRLTALRLEDRRYFSVSCF